MSKIYKSLTELVGSTPLLELTGVERKLGLEARLLVKLERTNPGGSVKDRIALAMIEAAEKSGLLQPGGVVIEPTSGNTGVGLAWAAAVKGYRVILTMPDTMSAERRNLLRAFGAQLVLTPGNEGMRGAIRRAEELQAEIPGAIIPQQFDNPANPSVHMRTTAEEIWADTDGEVDVFVAGVGTGGTVCGVAHGLKRHNPAIKVYAVEPETSAVLSGAAAGAHRIQGIGAGFVPCNYDAAVVNGVFRVADDDAFRAARLLARTEGILAGISSGAALCGAVALARLPENKGKTIVTVLPDTGERYLSTPLFDFDNYPLDDYD